MERNKNPAALEFAADRLAAALSPAHDAASREVSVSPDGLIRMSGLDRPIIAEAVERPSRPAVLDAWKQVCAYAEAVGAVPVVVLPRVTPSLRDLAEREGVNWIDFAGNARIEAPPFFVWIEGRRDGFGERKRGVNPFSGRSLNLIRVLLVDPGRSWRQKELAARSGLSQPRSSKVLATLEEFALVRRDDDGRFRVADADGLLDAWADAHSYRRHEIAPVHMTGEGIALARELAARFDEAEVIHWFTGLPAAWAYDHFARFRLVSVFVSADPAIVMQQLGLRYTDRGANVHLIAAAEQQLEIGQRTADGLKCVHPAQVYVDLRDLPERAAEAAEHLRPRVFAEADG